MGLAAPPPLSRGRRMKAGEKKRQRLLMTACVLDMLTEDEQKNLHGRLLGAKTIKRTRKKVGNMWEELGCYGRKAYRMSIETFDMLHDRLEPALREEFKCRPRKCGSPPNGEIPTKLRLSAAMRFFAGGSVYDIMLTHGIGRQSVYCSVYGVVDCVNKDKSLSFNENDAEFPTHDEQREIAKGFLAKSGAEFDKIVLAIDGMLVWTIQPTVAECEYLKIGARMFHCYRKDKYGYLLMAGCDHETKFRWKDIKHPAACSDYLAWMSSSVGRKLEYDDSDLILPGHSIAGDNAFVENMTMSTPIPSTNISEIEDAYNFYLSQLRITIERAFGILVHRWGVMRRPLSMSILKVPALVECLMRLHNYCIDNPDSRHTPGCLPDDAIAIHRCARRRTPNKTEKTTKTKKAKKPSSSIVLDELGSPSGLIGSGHHFLDVPCASNKRPTSKTNGDTPMRQLIQHIADMDLRRPTIL